MHSQYTYAAMEGIFSSQFWKLSAIWIVIISVSRPAWAYSRGAPSHACRNLEPMHGSDPQTSESPYSIRAETLPSENGQNFQTKVVLSGTVPFMGFLVQARHPTSDARTGTFVDLPALTSSMRCDRDNPASSITHTTADPKDEVVLTWQSPDNYTDPIIFKASFVQTQPVYWVGLEAEYNHVYPTTAVPLATDQATSIRGSKLSSVLQSLFSVSLVTCLIIGFH